MLDYRCPSWCFVNCNNEIFFIGLSTFLFNLIYYNWAVAPCNPKITKSKNVHCFIACLFQLTS